MIRVLGIALALVTTALAFWTVGRPMAPRHADLVQPLFARMDGNGDGGLDADEYGPLAGPTVPLPRVDIDGNGTISPAELEAFLLYVDPTRFSCMTSALPR